MPTRVTEAEIGAIAKGNPNFLAKSQIARDVVATLPDHQAEVFRRFWVPYFGPGISYSKGEIAKDLGMSEEQVHSLIVQTFVAIGQEWQRRKGATTKKPGQ